VNQDVVVQLIPVLAPVLVAIAIGYAWAKLGRDFDVRFLANMIHNVGMPCLIFSTLTKVDVDPEVFVDMAWASVATHLAFLIIGAFALRAARLPLSVYLNGMVYPNAGNIGLPLCLFAFGELGLALSTAWFTIDSVMVATLGVWVASGRFTMGDLMRAPLLYAALGAVMFLASGTKPPVWLANTTDLIGGLAIPLLLVMLGVSLGTLRVANLRRAFLLSLLRLGMGFAIGVVAADLFAFDGVERGVLIINCALSVGMVNYLISQYYDREPQEVAAMVVVSGFISIATLPLLVAYVLCKVLFRSRAGFMQLFRTLAFAYVPSIFLFFQIIPLYGVTLAGLTYLALIEYGVLALRPALNGSIAKALFASFVGWTGLLVVSLILSESQLFVLIQEWIAEQWT